MTSFQKAKPFWERNHDPLTEAGCQGHAMPRGCSNLSRFILEASGANSLNVVGLVVGCSFESAYSNPTVQYTG